MLPSGMSDLGGRALLIAGFPWRLETNDSALLNASATVVSYSDASIGLERSVISFSFPSSPQPKYRTNFKPPRSLFTSKEPFSPTLASMVSGTLALIRGLVCNFFCTSSLVSP